LNLRRPEEPVDAHGFHARGNIYSRNGSYERAIEDYSQAIEMDGDFAEAYFDRGFSFYEVGLYQESIADLTRAIELNPEAAHYYGQRSLVYLFADRLDLAEADQEMSDDLRNQGLE
jgi:tetratricopeptide (TPR) repeat protein